MRATSATASTRWTHEQPVSLHADGAGVAPSGVLLERPHVHRGGVPAWAPGDYVFDRGDGRPIDPDRLGKAFRAARDACQLQGVRLHDLRHGWASLMIGAGTQPRVDADLLGHSTVAFTLMTYVHPDEEAAQRVAEAAEALLGSALGEAGFQ